MMKEVYVIVEKLLGENGIKDTHTEVYESKLNAKKRFDELVAYHDRYSSYKLSVGKNCIYACVRVAGIKLYSLEIVTCKIRDSE